MFLIKFIFTILSTYNIIGYRMLKKLVISLLLLSAFSSYVIASTHYVNTATLKVRTGPTSASHHSYSIYKGHKVHVFEFKNNWARISNYKNENKNAKWVFGKFLTPIKTSNTTKYNNQVQEKVELPMQKPITKVKAKEVIEPIIEKKREPVYIQEKKYDKYALMMEEVKESQDFEKFEPLFVATSKRLFDNGTCQLKDFKRSKGWMELADKTIYFIYCGSIKRSNKIYLNVITGRATK